MSSIDSKDIIEKMLRNDGTYPGDPPSYSIWQYKTMFGGSCFKLCGSQGQEANFLNHGAYQGQPELLFIRHSPLKPGEVTQTGKVLLGEDTLEGEPDGVPPHAS